LKKPVREGPAFSISGEDAMVIRQRPRKSGQSHRLLLRTILKQRELIFINRAEWREASEWDRENGTAVRQVS
jgi:hypothetical protein